MANNPTPPLSEAVVALAEALTDAFDNTAQLYHLQPADVMVGLGAATAMIIQHTANQARRDPQKMLDDYRASLKLPPAPEEAL